MKPDHTLTPCLTRTGKLSSHVRPRPVAGAPARLLLNHGQDYDAYTVAGAYISGATFDRAAFALVRGDTAWTFDAIGHVREHRTSHAKWFPVSRVAAASRNPLVATARASTPTASPDPLWWHPYRKTPPPAGAVLRRHDVARTNTGWNVPPNPYADAARAFFDTQPDDTELAVHEIAAAINAPIDNTYTALERLEREGVVRCVNWEQRGRMYKRFTKRPPHDAADALSPATDSTHAVA